MTDRQLPFVTSVCLFNKKDEYVKEHYYPMTVSAARMKELSYLEMMRDFRKTKERYQMASGADEINLCFRVYGDAMEELGICVIGIARQGAEDIFDEISNYSHGNWIVTDQNRNILISGEKGKAADELNSLDMNFSGEKKDRGSQRPVRVKKSWIWDLCRGFCWNG